MNNLYNLYRVTWSAVEGDTAKIIDYYAADGVNQVLEQLRRVHIIEIVFIGKVMPL